jgi:hypothetical protein
MKQAPGSAKYCSVRIAGLLLIAVCLMAGLPGCPPRPTEIRDWYGLHAIRDDMEKNYVLTNDLDAATPGYAELAGPTANGGRGWTPIGTSTNSFVGSFDGRGYEIRGLHVNRPDEDYVGLFACTSWMRHTDNFGVINNVAVVDAQVIGSANVGALVGHNGGIVSDCYASGAVRGSERVGGLIGWNQRTILSSRSSCSVDGDTAVGGLTGDNWLRATISNSYSDGSVTGYSRVGGLVGWNYYGNLTNSYSAGPVTGSTRVGGLVGGMLGGSVVNSFWDAEASGTMASEGGTGKTLAQMRNITTFTDTATAGLEEAWDLGGVVPGATDRAHIWNIVDGQTYPFLSWQPRP